MIEWVTAIDQTFSRTLEHLSKYISLAWTEIAVNEVNEWIQWSRRPTLLDTLTINLHTFMQTRYMGEEEEKKTH